MTLQFERDTLPYQYSLAKYALYFRASLKNKKGPVLHLCTNCFWYCMKFFLKGKT